MGKRETPKLAEATSSPATGVTSNRAVAGDDFDDYRPPVWDELERIVDYKVTDENQAQAILDGNRSPLEKHYAEFVAAKRNTEPQVIVRHGICQVLGMR
jgi:hypothetical protein